MIMESDIVVDGPTTVEAVSILTKRLGQVTLEEIEGWAPDVLRSVIEGEPAWGALTKLIRETYRRNDHVLIRGIGPTADPRILMAVACTIGGHFLTFGEGKVVKLFAMNPWSRALAHTAAEGFFHTDLNASPNPPAITAIQCVRQDPGAPDYGLNRVARLPDLLQHLTNAGEDECLAFLTEHDVEMANKRSSGTWCGRIVHQGVLRFHPETVRAAAKRRQATAPERILETIQRTCIAISRPIDLGAGDILLLSNHRTLHYRGECSIRFSRFPLEYEARQIHMLNMRDERS